MLCHVVEMTLSTFRSAMCVVFVILANIQNSNILRDRAVLSSILATFFVAENEAFSTKNAHSERHNRFQCVSIPHRSHSAPQSAQEMTAKSPFSRFSNIVELKNTHLLVKSKNRFFLRELCKSSIFSFVLAIMSNYHKHIFQ